MKSLASTILVLILVLGTLAALILGQGIGEPLVPSPETIVQEFVSHMSEERYEEAQSGLDDDLRQEMTFSRLQQLDQSLKQKLGRYEFQLGGDQVEQGDRATYEAHINTEKEGEQDYTFELKRDDQTGLWEISALDEMEQSAQQEGK